jgi:hypothetical protein
MKLRQVGARFVQQSPLAGGQAVYIVEFPQGKQGTVD